MAITVILLLGLALRLVNLNQSLWLDEAVQAITSQGSFAGIFRELRGDFHPPLYHILMWIWVRLFGSSEVILRLPSVLFGVGTIWVVYKIAKGISPARLVALLMATAPFHIYYSQEARMYAMATFFACLSVYWFLRLIGEEREKKGKGGKKGKRRLMLGYVIATTALLYSDYYGFLVMLAQIIASLFIFRKKIATLLHCYIAIFLFYLPVVLLLFVQLKTGLRATQTLPGWGRLVNVNFVKALPLTFIKFILGRITIFNRKLYALVAGALFGVLGMIGVRGWCKKRNKGSFYTAVLLWLVVPILFAWLTSLFIPNYQPFRLLLSLPALYLLLAMGIVSIQDKKLKAVALVFILFTSCFSLFTYYANPYFHREDWRGVANYLKDEQLLIVISSKTFDWPLVYYEMTDEIVRVGSGVRPVADEDRIGQIEKEKVAYTPYLADIYDPSEKVPNWLRELGYVKIKEISFNQIPVWIYAYRN